MSEDARLMSEWSRGLAGPAALTFVRTGKAGDALFLRFCREFAVSAPMVDIVTVSDRPGEGPALEIRSNLRYRAIPAGPELGPFLEALADPPSDPAAASSDAAPAGLRLYIAERCPFCPSVVRTLLPLTVDGGPMDLTIIDAGMFPDDAAADGVRSVPTLVLDDPARDDRIRWTGALNIPEILSIIATRDASRLGAESMAQMIEEGNASGLAEMMLECGRIFPAFIDLLTHEKWPTRLGAMVAAETIAGRSGSIGGQLVEPLWERFHKSDDTVQGDILYVLGAVGDAGVLARLRSVLDGPYPAQVKEAAQEAFEAICATPRNGQDR